MYNLSDYSYNLPENLIAQKPIEPADASKLLLYNKEQDAISNAFFSDLPDLLTSNDVIFFNDTKVLPARIPLHNVKVVTRLGREVELENGELFFLEQKSKNSFEGLMTLLKRNRPGMKIYIDDIVCELIELTEKGGIFELTGSDVMSFLLRYGQMPLPPYIAYDDDSAKHYQTAFAQHDGSVAAPTASLHFTENLLSNLKAKHIQQEFVTLHVGLGTFKPVDTSDIRDYHIHEETIVLDISLFEKLATLKQSGKNIVAVGTTVSRVLETLPYLWKLLTTQGKKDTIRNTRSQAVILNAVKDPEVDTQYGFTSYSLDSSAAASEGQDYRHTITQDISLEQAEKYIMTYEIISPTQIQVKTRIFMYPGFQRRIVDSLITNFHLPQSTLLMLVASFIGYDNMKKIYAYAVEQKYRFYSFGDGMLLRK